MNTKTSLQNGVAVCAICADATGADGKPADWVQLVPLGEFKGRDGRGPWTIRDKAHAEAIVAASQQRAGSMDLVIDYDHQSDYGVKPGVGGTAPAAGWMKELQVRDDGIWARSEWTAAAAEKLQGREYRYLSPVFQHTPDGAVTRILRAGLINTPNLDLVAVAAEQSQEHEDVSLKSRLIAALALSASATDDQVVEAATSAVTAAGELNTIRTKAGAEAGASTDVIITALQGQAEPDPARFVPIATFTAVNQQLAELRNTTTAETAETAVNNAVESGLILPASKDWALGYAKKDLAGFKAYVGTLTPIVTAGEKKPDGGKAPEQTAVLSDAEKSVCQAMGWDEAEFLKSKKEQG